MKKIIAILLIGFILLIPMAQAQEKSKKLFRGVTNLMTGWVELPKNIYDTTIEESISKGVTVGLVEGLGMAIVRTGCGVYETVTFPFPIPEDYKPILEPEFVFETQEVVILEIVEVNTPEIIDE